jgi:hypothetical protein
MKGGFLSAFYDSSSLYTLGRAIGLGEKSAITERTCIPWFRITFTILISDKISFSDHYLVI